MDIGLWLQNNQTLLILVVILLVVLAVLQRLFGGIWRMARRRKAPKLHPKLQRYAGRSDADIEAARLAAENIITTSSTGTIAGYDIVRQIDAVFVEGHRAQGEAIAALKAVAGRRGANAIINVTQQHTAAGRCSAQGDAVLVRPVGSLDDDGAPRDPDR